MIWEITDEELIPQRIPLIEASAARTIERHEEADV
jgi:hypothetical protein